MLFFLQPRLIRIHMAVRTIEYLLNSMIRDRHKLRQPRSHDRSFSHADILLHLLSQNREQSDPVIEILSSEDHDEFVSSNTEHRAVGKDPADQPAGGFDIFIPCPVALCIINDLQSIDIADNNAKELFSFFDLPLQLSFHFMIGRLVFRVRKRIAPGHFVCHGKSFKMFLFPADNLLPVLNTDDKMAVIGRVGHRHAGILLLFVAKDHSIILRQLPAGLKLGYQMILVEKGPDPVPVIVIYVFVNIYTGCLKEIISLILDLKFAVFLLSGIFRIFQASAVYVVDQIEAGCQSLSDPGVDLSLFLIFLNGKPGPDLRVNILYTDNNVLAVFGHDLRMADMAYYSLYL